LVCATCNRKSRKVYIAHRTCCSKLQGDNRLPPPGKWQFRGGGTSHCRHHSHNSNLETEIQVPSKLRYKYQVHPQKNGEQGCVGAALPATTAGSGEFGLEGTERVLVDQVQ
jgi:hypothetical protein